MARYVFTFALILLAALSRLLPHPLNFAPITAIALFGGVFLDKKHTFIVPIAALLISDYFLGFYPDMGWVYGSFILIGFLGLWLRKHYTLTATVGTTLAGSILFFIVTNFGAWLGYLHLYTRDLPGLIQCYTAAIPFFRNTLAGDFVYVGVMFGAYELARRFIPALNRPQRVNAA